MVILRTAVFLALLCVPVATVLLGPACVEAVLGPRPAPDPFQEEMLWVNRGFVEELRSHPERDTPEFWGRWQEAIRDRCRKYGKRVPDRIPEAVRPCGRAD